jgi:hypothetical protein
MLENIIIMGLILSVIYKFSRILVKIDTQITNINNSFKCNNNYYEAKSKVGVICSNQRNKRKSASWQSVGKA